MKFEKGSFAIATMTGVQQQSGWMTELLGLHLAPGGWVITHLNSGLIAMTFRAPSPAKALEIAEKVAALDGWDFIGIEEGWKNRNPDLPRQVEAIYREIGQPTSIGDDSPATAAQRAAAAAIQTKRIN